MGEQPRRGLPSPDTPRRAVVEPAVHASRRLDFRFVVEDDDGEEDALPLGRRVAQRRPTRGLEATPAEDTTSGPRHRQPRYLAPLGPRPTRSLEAISEPAPVPLPRHSTPRHAVSPTGPRRFAPLPPVDEPQPADNLFTPVPPPPAPGRAVAEPTPPEGVVDAPTPAPEPEEVPQPRSGGTPPEPAATPTHPASPAITPVTPVTPPLVVPALAAPVSPATPVARSTPSAAMPGGPRRVASQAPREGWWTRLRRLLEPAPKYSRVRGDIEGLRAIAVTWVLLFHLDVPGFSGGFSGVDVFFVISGFLITSHMVASASRRHLNLVEFWSARVRRLVPAATLLLIFTACASLATMPRSQWRSMGIDLLAAAGYVVNWVLADRAVDYLAEQGTSPVQHFWSLAVEEQFYVVWPVVVLAVSWVAHRLRQRVVVWVGAALAGIVAASLWWSVTATAADPARAYFVSTTRAWELGVGGLLACAIPLVKRLRRWAVPLSLVGVAMVVSSAFVVSTESAWPGWLALLPVLGTAAVLMGGVADGENRVATVLGWGPMRGLGALSYAIYLWHWPLIVFARELLTSPAQPDLPWSARLGIIALSVVLAWVSGAAIETPIRFGDLPAWRGARALRNAVACMLVPGLVGVGAWAVAPRLDGSVGAVPSYGALRPRATPATASSATPRLAVGSHLGALALVANVDATAMPTLRDDLVSALQITGTLVPDPQFADKDLPPGYASKCQRPRGETTVVGSNDCLSGNVTASYRVAMVGDSKADQWQPAFDLIGQRQGWRVQNLTKSGCTFTTTTERRPDCNVYNGALLSRLLDDPPDLLVTSSMMFNPESWRGMIEMLRQVNAKGTQILIIADSSSAPPHTSVYQCLQKAKGGQCEFARNDGDGTPALTRVHRALPGSLMISMNDWVCPPKRSTCPAVVGNVVVHRQTNHLSNTYVMTLVPILERALVQQGLLAHATLPLQP